MAHPNFPRGAIAKDQHFRADQLRKEQDHKATEQSSYRLHLFPPQYAMPNGLIFKSSERSDYTLTATKYTPGSKSRPRSSRPSQRTVCVPERCAPTGTSATFFPSTEYARNTTETCSGKP